MLDVFGAVRSLLTINPVCIDNWVFLLHHKVTVVMLLVCSTVVTSYQYIGTPISCVSDSRDYTGIMNSFCWITATFTVPERDGRAGDSTLRQGVGPRQPDDREPDRYHNYYQWVYFALFFQAIAFYVPRYLWKTLEGGRMRSLVDGLEYPPVGSECRADRVSMVVKYFRTYMHAQDSYAAKFFLCEVLNLVNVLGQMYFMDRFIGNGFRTYGWDVFTCTDDDGKSRCREVMDRVFPKLTKCTFNIYGPSGSIQNLDVMCVLAANTVNETIYAGLWLWFILVATVTLLQLSYSVIVTISLRVRTIMLTSRIKNKVTRAEIKAITRHLRIGDWFVLYQVSKNVNWQVFEILVSELTVEVDRFVADQDKGKVDHEKEEVDHEKGEADHEKGKAELDNGKADHDKGKVDSAADDTVNNP